MEFLSQINAMLVDKLGPLGPLIAIGGLGVLLIVMALPTMLNKPEDPLDKLKRAASGQQSPAEKTKTPAKQLRNSGGPADKLQKFANFLEPQNEEEMTAARLKMLRAGYRSKAAVRTFHAAQFVFGIGFLVVGLVYALILSHQQDVSTQTLILYTVIPGGAGYMLPQYWVTRRAATRQQEIIDGFPDALDMMLVCVEAGQSLDQSIIRVAKELGAGYPALAEEFEMVAHEVKAGKDRVSVLRDMSERAGVPDVSSFVTVMIQSASFGTSIAEALRVFSAEMRDKRVMRAEEKANKLPTKLTLGTMMFTVPPLMLILIGPSIYGMVKALGGGLGKF
ncbi:type II secretion system F family protein [Acidimangrovimonas sediminis]|uniref:type II secretion system F family protein n=1 Tax=Acidimangrovimonas sediminis TaxID=2056283 RepID=UPI000C8103D8|nr:type II secretion system F family protein [Acidimangrovimonas sediminis]